MDGVQTTSEQVQQPQEAPQAQAEQTPVVNTDEQALAKNEETQENISIKQHNQQMAQMRRQLEEKQASLDALKAALDGKDTTLEELKTQAQKVLEEQKQAQERFEKQTLTFALENALTKAGCIDVVGAQAHIDLTKLTFDEQVGLKGADIDGLKAQAPWLFAQPKTYVTAGKQASQKGDDFEATLRKQFDLGA